MLEIELACSGKAISALKPLSYFPQAKSDYLVHGSGDSEWERQNHPTAKTEDQKAKFASDPAPARMASVYLQNKTIMM